MIRSRRTNTPNSGGCSARRPASSRPSTGYWSSCSATSAALERYVEAPSLYEEFLRHLARAGLPVPAAAIERDFSIVREPSAEVVDVLRTIYDDPATHWASYEVCEALMDVGNNFQFWRFHHMKTVERIIGHKRGSGGSSGVAFLKRAIEQEFFPELIQVRTEIGQ